MAASIPFCQGCNERFDLSATGAPCPNCGLSLVSLDAASTANIEDVRARELYADQITWDRQRRDGLVGRELAGYRVEELVGVGGMARVYRAKHLLLRRLCALKVISPALVSRNPDYLTLFFNEARTAAALVHPNVVTVHNIGIQDAYHFIEMEFVEGLTLRRLVDERGRLEPVRATNFMLQICQALAEAHRREMVHRDLKPANVLVSLDGTAKLADFGLAKTVVAEDLPSGNVGLLGTPYFMAPELFQGKPASSRSDIYAMGISFFFLLTGVFPFRAHTLSGLAKNHAEQPVPEISERVPETPDSIRSILAKCLAKDEYQRYPDAAALQKDLRAAFGNLRDMDTLIGEALEGLDLEWGGERNSFHVNVRLSNGRSQKVMIEASSSGPLARRIVKIYSISAPLRKDYLRRALELNASIPYGSIAVQESQGEPHFILIDTYPRATCDPEEVRASILSIGRWADVVERILTGEDRF